jgi:hypothetical protein
MLRAAQEAMHAQGSVLITGDRSCRGMDRVVVHRIAAATSATPAVVQQDRPCWAARHPRPHSGRPAPACLRSASLRMRDESGATPESQFSGLLLLGQCYNVSLYESGLREGRGKPMIERSCSRRPAVAGMGDWRQRGLSARASCGERFSCVAQVRLCLGVMERSPACVSDA